MLDAGSAVCAGGGGDALIVKEDAKCEDKLKGASSRGGGGGVDGNSFISCTYSACELGFEIAADKFKEPLPELGIETVCAVCICFLR